jgi:LAO/AO transport system kinase
MATRGSLGGIADKTKSVCDLLDAFGFDYIFIETVGVGQVEIDIMDASHITVVVLAPESGDGIQTLKAGLMEIGSVFVVNKGDRDGADNLVNLIRYTLELKQDNSTEDPPVIKAISTQSLGVDELVKILCDQCQTMKRTGIFDEKRESWIRKEIRGLVQKEVLHSFWKQDKKAELLDTCAREVLDGKLTPFEARAIILKKADTETEKAART